MNIEEISDDVLQNVFDSEMVAEEVIRNSFTVASQVLTTNKLIHDVVR